jgi:hypothetical protein
LEVLGLKNAVNSDGYDRFSTETIKFWLLVLAFITPFVLEVGPLATFGIRIEAPIWQFGTRSYPIFRIIPPDMLIAVLPFILIRLLFIRYVLLYKERLTTVTTLILTGILCELPYPTLAIIFAGNWVIIPFPLFLIVGLLMARYSTKDPISWLEAEEI